MKSRNANLALIAVAIASIGATSPTRGPVGPGTLRSSAATSAQVNAAFASRTMMRWRALLAIPKHRSRSQRRPVALANAKNVATYQVIDLQRSLPPNSVLYPAALSNSGRILGNLDSHSAYILNEDGTGAVLPSYSDGSGGTTTIYPMSINNTGQTAVGWYTVNYPDPDYDPYSGGIIWPKVGSADYYLTTPQLLASVANQNIAPGYNEYYTSSGASGSLLTNACGRKPTGTLIGDVINDSGLIGGNSGLMGYGSGGPDPAQVFKIGGCPTTVPNLAPGNSHILAITKNGDLLIDETGVDFSTDALVVWKQGKVYRIPYPSNSRSPTHIEGYGINASDMIVGEYSDAAGTKPFVYANGTSVDLASLFPPNSGWDPVAVTGINDSGEIIGVGYKGNDLKGFALKPDGR